MEIYNRLLRSIAYLNMQEAVRKAIDPHPGDVIVDIGCGPFNTLSPLAKRGDLVLRGVDRTPTAVDIARETLRSAGIENVEIQCADALCYLNGIPDESVDRVVTVNTLYVMENSKEVLRQIYRVLKPGGLVVIADILPSFKPKMILFANLLWRLLNPFTAPYWIVHDVHSSLRILEHNKPLIELARLHGRTIEEYREVLSGMGFFVLEARPIYVWQAGLYVAEKSVKNEQP